MSDETDVAGAPPPTPTMMQKMAKLLRNVKGGKKDPQDVADVVPEGLMPHEALAKKKAQRAKMDVDTKD